MSAQIIKVDFQSNHRISKSDINAIKKSARIIPFPIVDRMMKVIPPETAVGEALVFDPKTNTVSANPNMPDALFFEANRYLSLAADVQRRPHLYGFRILGNLPI